MSHYSDIGFDIKDNKDIDNLIDMFFNSKEKLGVDVMVWEIENNPNNLLGQLKYGDLRFFIKGDLENGKIDDFFVGHDNKNITNVEVEIEENPIKKNEKNYFPIFNFYKDDIPFWVACFNADIFFFYDDNTSEVKLVSFANHIMDVRDAKKINKELKMANESYISYFNDDITTGWLSGIIKDFALLENPITHNKYYAIDIVSMGLKIKLVVDPKLIENKELKKGKVICGEFWNTGILVADNHPDYF